MSGELSREPCSGCGVPWEAVVDMETRVRTAGCESCFEKGSGQQFTVVRCVYVYESECVLCTCDHVPQKLSERMRSEAASCSRLQLTI